MSSYNSRRGPNVSQYIRDLNAIPQDTPAQDFGNMEDDLSLFTNTQFFDYDSGQNTDFQAQPVKLDVKAATNATANNTAGNTPDTMTPATAVMGDMANLDFSMSNEFGFGDFSNAYTGPPMNAFSEGPQNFQHMQQPNHASPVYGGHVPQSRGQFPQGGPSTAHGDKSKAESVASPTRPANFEEASRQAAEEDKRRRNTAASARFRVKKKQREQALEKSAKEMTDKVSALENKVSQLETENKWLKNLLVEKNEGNDEISALWKEFTKQAIEKNKAKTVGEAQADR